MKYHDIPIVLRNLRYNSVNESLGKAMGRENTAPIHNLSDYQSSVVNASTHSEWWRQFVSLLHSLQGVQLTDLHIEKQKYEGCEYTLVGNVIFEFNRFMHKGWGDSTASLKRYLTNLKIHRSQANFTAIATDGLLFHVYRPQFNEAGLLVEMKTVSGLNLASPMMSPTLAQKEIGHMLSDLQG